MAGRRKDGGRKVAGDQAGKLGRRVLRLAFVRSFVAGPVGVRGSATRAAVHAGLASTPESGRKVGHRLMHDPTVTQAIDRAMERSDVSNERLIHELSRIAFSDIREVVTWAGDTVTLKPSSELDDETAAAIAEVSERKGKDGSTLRVKLHSKLEALALLARIRAMIVPAPRVEVNANGPVQVQVYLPENGRGHLPDLEGSVERPVRQVVPPALPAGVPADGPIPVAELG